VSAAQIGASINDAGQAASCGSQNAEPISGQKQREDRKPARMGNPISRRAAMTALASASVAVTTTSAISIAPTLSALDAPTSGGRSDDAELLALGRELKAAWAHENEQFRISEAVHDDAELHACQRLLSPRRRSVVDSEILNSLGVPHRAILTSSDIELLRTKQPVLGPNETRRVQEIVNAHDRYCRRAAELDLDGVEARTEAANAATKAIVARIEATPAHTLAGLMVKVEAVRWCRTGDLTDEELSSAATDSRICQTILLDIAAMAGVPQLGHQSA
jgi:hypothetical protein